MNIVTNLIVYTASALLECGYEQLVLAPVVHHTTALLMPWVSIVTNELQRLISHTKAHTSKDAVLIAKKQRRFH